MRPQNFAWHPLALTSTARTKILYGLIVLSHIPLQIRQKRRSSISFEDIEMPPQNFGLGSLCPRWPRDPNFYTAL